MHLDDMMGTLTDIPEQILMKNYNSIAMVHARNLYTLFYMHICCHFSLDLSAGLIIKEV